MRYVLLICGATRWPKRFLDKRVSGCPNDSAVIVEHNLYRHVLEQGLHAAFVQEGLHEYRALHPGNDFCSDAAADENAAGGHEIQGAVSRLGPEYSDENRKSLIADRGLALQS